MAADVEQERANRTEERLRKAEQLEREKEAVWNELEVQGRLVDENTARLKALRMAKERAATSAAAAEIKAKVLSKQRKRAAKK